MVAHHRDTPLAERYLDVAESDLRAADLLFKNKFYPQALFYLQQSVEKAVIAVLLHGGRYGDLIRQITTRNKANRHPIHHQMVRHSFTHLSQELRRFVTNLRRIKLFGMTADQYLNQVLERYERYSNADVTTIIDNISRIEEDLRNLRMVEQQLAEQPNEIENIIRQIDGHRFDIGEKIRKLFGGLIEGRVKDLSIQVQIHQSSLYLPLVRLGVLGIITENFAVVTRYYVRGMNVGPDSFNELNPVVRAWNTFYQTALETHNLIRQRLIKK